MWDDLVCPTDHGCLERCHQWLSCTSCGRGYPILDGIPTFLAADESPFWRARQQARIDALPADNDNRHYRWLPELRRRARFIEHLLSAHIPMRPTTKILQVGLHAQGELHHLGCGVRYGVDPLAGVLASRGLLKRGQVRWVTCCGEQLPFGDRNFDAILLCDVLHCVASPRRVFLEARRCLREDGLLLVTQPCGNRAWHPRTGSTGVVYPQPGTERRIVARARGLDLGVVDSGQWNTEANAWGDDEHRTWAGPSCEAATYWLFTPRSQRATAIMPEHSLMRA